MRRENPDWEPGGDDEETAARLLCRATARPDIPAERADRVRDAVRDAWQASVDRRRVRRLVVVAVVATAAAIAIAMAIRPLEIRHPASGAAADLVARVERIEGHVRRSTPDLRSALTPIDLRQDDRVVSGDVLETDGRSRTALRLKDGTSLRLDGGARARMLSSTIIELTNGAVYIDSVRNDGGIEVRTPLGTARDVGTQFEVRVSHTLLRVRVRSGSVELRHRDRSASALAGTELVLADGEISRRAITPFGPEWEWTASVAPRFDIDGRPLASFIDHLCREHGWTVHYEDDELARRSWTNILHGSVRGLPPTGALEVALATSGLEHRFDGGDLSIYRSPNAR